MKTMKIAIIMLLCAAAIGAEEVLSSQPVVIAPKRIESETVPLASRAVESEGHAVSINAQLVIAKIQFKKGSIRLLPAMRKQLNQLGLKTGQKLRITGFADAGAGKGNAVKLANLRARVIASYLAEQVGDLNVELQWNGRPPEGFTDAGAVLERGE
jgi:outer membrane protein OmpA-like peptidoglycan-associated protein